MSDSIVFVTQQLLTRDENGAWRPKFDVSPAQEYGRLEYLFGAGQVALMPEAVADAINARLDELQYDPARDYMLVTGDTTLGVQACEMMMARGGCRLLRWDGKYRRYTVYNVQEGSKYDDR